MTYANGDYEVYTYDRYGRVATIAHYDDGNTLNYTEIYIYDGNGNTGPQGSGTRRQRSG